MSLLLFAAFETAAVPPGPPPLPYASAFAALVLQMDRAATAHLGGQPVIYAPETGAPVTISGVFDELYVLAKGEPDTGVGVLGPAVFLRLEDIPVDPEVDDPILTIGGLDYEVIERRPDGLGGIVLPLRRVVE